MRPERQPRKLAALFSASAEGYGRLVQREVALAVEILRDHARVIEAAVERNSGRVAESTSGGVLAEFASVGDALICAIESQREIGARDAAVPEERRLPFRIGLHLGEVVEEGGRLYGEGVQVAALVAGVADPGGVCISTTARDHVKNQTGVGYKDLGNHDAEDVSEPARVYRVVLEPEGAARRIGRLWSRLKRRQKIGLALAVALAQGAGGLLVKRYIDRPAPQPSTIEQRQISAAPTKDKLSVAVLPFDNLTGDPQQGYFADGFAEQIITSLSKIPGLAVASRGSSFSYKGKPVKTQQVSQELSVRYVLEGSVQTMSSRIRINVQLNDATLGRQVWADSYDREVKDVFALQDELLLKILTALNVTLTYGDRARTWAQGTRNVEAYLKTMQCREYSRRWNSETTPLMRRTAEEAIALDPQYADPYALLAQSYMMDLWTGRGRREENIAKSVEWAQKALALNRSLMSARYVMVLLHAFMGSHDEAIAEAERALELDPTSGEANYKLAEALKYAGKPREAIPWNQKALRMEPIVGDLWVRNLALLHVLAGSCSEALATLDTAPVRYPDNINSRVMMAITFGACGRDADARREAAEVLRINPKFSVSVFTAVVPYKRQSDKDQIAAALRKAGLP